MNKKQGSLLTLTMIALLVGIINGIFDIAYNMQRTFEASVTNDYGESLKVRVVADSGRPPFLWYLAWRVGNNPVTTVNIGITIIPSGTNVGNLKVTYYIKGVSGTHSKKFLSATSLSATNGQQITNSTGNIDINAHLSQMGLSTTQDQTVNYKVYCKVEGTGLISGEPIIAEISETPFDTVFYDYGTNVINTFQVSSGSDDAGIDAIYGWKTSISGTYMGKDAYDSVHGFRFTNIPLEQGATIISAKLGFYETQSLSSTRLYTNIYGDDEGNCATFSTENDLLNRPKTTAMVSWNQNGFNSGVWYWTSDVASIIQEIVDRSDWSYGNSLALIVYAGDQVNADSYFYAKIATYEFNPDWAPKLQIEYLDYSASWNWFNLPLSVVSLPIGQQFLAIVFMILAFSVWAVAREKKRRKGRSKR